MTQSVLCIPAHQAPAGVLAAKSVGSYGGALPNSAWMIPRQVAETDPKFLQIIPYVCLRDSETNAVFHYTRGDNIEEARLASKRSIGLGGHIEWMDVRYTKDGIDMEATILACAKRELLEEVGVLLSASAFTRMRYIFDPTTDVGRVHLGVMFEARCLGSLASRHEQHAVCNGGFSKLADLRKFQGEFEPWSNVAMQELNHLLRAEPSMEAEVGE